MIRSLRVALGFVATALAASHLFSAPPVASRVDSALLSSDGKRLTLSGAFPSRQSSSPLKWDTFEAAEVGARLGNGWFTDYAGGNLPPTVTTDRTRPGSTKSVRQDFTTGSQYNSTVGLTGLSATKLFVSFWKYTTTNGKPSRNYKYIAFRGGSSGDWQLPNGRHDVYPYQGSGHLYLADCDGTIRGNSWTNAYELREGAWQRFDYQIDLGTPEIPNAAFTWWLDGSLKTTLTGFVGRADQSCVITNVYLNAYFARDLNDAASMSWLDDIYIDTEGTRIEVCDSQDWEQRTHCEIQPSVAWLVDSSGTGTVEIALNKGAFGQDWLQTAYAFVIDDRGQASAGFPLSGTPQPKPPTGIRVTRGY